MNIHVPEYARSYLPALSQGTLVHFILPYAKTLELTGRQTGIILSRDDYNRPSGRPCICPIIYGENPINERLGIKIPTHSGVTSYLRPDLASYIGIAYGRVQPIRRKDNDQPCIFPHELTRRAYRKFIEIIRPTPEKLAQKGHGFLAYAEIGYSREFPRADEDKADPAPILNLLPSDIYRETGMTLVVRGYSHVERFNPRHDIAVGAQRWFETGFFNVSDIKVVPTKGTLASRSGCSSVLAGERALKGFAKKEEANFDAEVYAEVVARYSTPIGRLPGHVTSARKNHIHFTQR